MDNMTATFLGVAHELLDERPLSCAYKNFNLHSRHDKTKIILINKTKLHASKQNSLVTRQNPLTGNETLFFLFTRVESWAPKIDQLKFCRIKLFSPIFTLKRKKPSNVTFTFVKNHFRITLFRLTHRGPTASKPIRPHTTYHVATNAKKFIRDALKRSKPSLSHLRLLKSLSLSRKRETVVHGSTRASTRGRVIGWLHIYIYTRIYVV